MRFSIAFSPQKGLGLNIKQGEVFSSKEPISEGVEGCFLRSFLRGLRVRLVLFKSNSSIGYFTLTGISRQESLFTLLIFSLQLAERFFHSLGQFLSYNFYQLLNEIPVIQQSLYFTIGPLQLAIHVAQNPPRAGEQKSPWDKTKKENYHFNTSFVCLVPVRLLLSSTAVLYHVNSQLQRANEQRAKILPIRARCSICLKCLHEFSYIYDQQFELNSIA